MSVAASRWAVDYLKTHPAPDKGGLSRGARATLLALAIHAGYPPRGAGAHVATVSAGTLAKVLGRHERNVRADLTELADRSVLPVIRPPGRAAEWHFVIAPMSTTPGDSARGELSTTPGDSDATPGDIARRRDEGDVLTVTDAVPRGAPVTVSVSVDHVPPGATWDDYYAPERMNGGSVSVR